MKVEVSTGDYLWSATGDVVHSDAYSHTHKRFDAIFPGIGG
jgi:hypothetical protein